MKILFETIGYTTITDCPHGMSPNVGSELCESCEYFVSMNDDWNEVECGYEQE